MSEEVGLRNSLDDGISGFETAGWIRMTGSKRGQRAVHLARGYSAKAHCGTIVPTHALRGIDPIAQITCARCARRARALAALVVFAERERAG